MVSASDSHRFSFIVPTYNEAQNIERTISDIRRCFAHEPEGSYEIVVVDNGSSDDTVEIAGNMNVRCVVDESLNISEMRNLGAKLASGDVLVFIDADVSLGSNWLEAVRRRQSSLTHEARRLVGSHCRPDKSTPFLIKHWLIGGYENPRSAFLPAAHTIVNRDLFNEIGGFNTDYWTNEDVELGIRATRMGCEILHCDEIPAFHRGDPQSILEFLKRECWHGTADFLTARQTIRSMPALGAISFIVLHLSGGLALLADKPTPALTFVGAIVVQLAVTSAYLFPKSSLRTRILNAVTAYLYYLGRSCSLRALFFKSYRNHNAAKSSGRRG